MSSPFGDRLFRGYGPLIGFAAIFLAVAVLVPSQQREVRIESAGADAAAKKRAAATEETVPTDTAPVDTALAFTDPNAAGGGGGGTGAGGGAGSRQGGGPAGAGAGKNTGPPQIAGCGAAQIPGDPYSPPCVKFSGSNGGATSRGVTDTEINVSVRLAGFSNGLGDALSKVAKAKIPDESPELIRRTVEGLAEYFNSRFQLYNRKFKLTMFDGKGDPLKELTGGGQEGAQADALKVAQEIQAFAEIAAVSPPFADALSAKQVVNIGVPYTSREWMTERRPYSWSQFIDCSSAVESVSSYYVTKVADKPAALAGGDLKNQPRKAAIIAPDSSWYQDCVNAGINLITKAGKTAPMSEKYKIDLNAASAQADTEIRKLKDAGITTIVCGCDPLILTFLTAKAKEQNYSPEWMITGVALVDNDLIGQIQEQGQWSRSFGVSFAGPTQPQQNSLGYRAYKSVRKDEPSLAVDLIYNEFYLLAIGVQGAGPNLTPQSFEKGMFDYPTKSGPYGTIGFGPNDYTGPDDAREIFYNPGAVSAYNRAPGTYQDPNGGARFPIGQWNANPPRTAAG